MKLNLPTMTMQKYLNEWHTSNLFPFIFIHSFRKKIEISKNSFELIFEPSFKTLVSVDEPPHSKSEIDTKGKTDKRTELNRKTDRQTYSIK